MSIRIGILIAIVLLPSGCNGGRNDAPSDGSGAAPPPVQIERNPKTDLVEGRKVVRAQLLVDSWIRVLRNTSDELHRITDEKTALKGAELLQSNAKSLQNTAKKLIEIGRLTPEDNKSISLQGLEAAQAAHSTANKKVAALLAGGTLSQNADKAVRSALISWGKANIAISEAMLALAPPKKPGIVGRVAYAPPDAGFSVEFPSRPHTGTVGTGKDQLQTAAVKRTVVDGLGFVVYWKLRDAPFNDAATAEAYALGQQKGITAKGKLIMEKKINTLGQIGREFIVTLNSSTTMRCRVFAVNKLICTLVVQGRDPKSVRSDDAERFLDSFRRKDD